MAEEEADRLEKEEALQEGNDKSSNKKDVLEYLNSKKEQVGSQSIKPLLCNH